MEIQICGKQTKGEVDNSWYFFLLSHSLNVFGAVAESVQW